MTWTDFYLICFLVGFALSVLSFILGGLHLHIPHIHFHFHGGHIHTPHGGGGNGISIFNFASMAAFLAWFGGTGYLLSRYFSVTFFVALGVAVFSGIGGASVIFFFLAKVLISKEEDLNPADYDMIGVLGRITSPIRAGGTGEITFTQGGTRHVSAARTPDGVAIPKGKEVVVTRYERGIAYVQLWDELAAMDSQASFEDPERRPL